MASMSPVALRRSDIPTFEEWMNRYASRNDDRKGAKGLREDISDLKAPKGKIWIEATVGFLEDLFSALFPEDVRILVEHNRPGWFEVYVLRNGKLLGGTALKGTDVLLLSEDTLRSCRMWALKLP